MASKVYLTNSFKRDVKKLAKKHLSIPADLKLLITELEEDPYLGVRLSGDSYKVRFAIKSKGKGKSGGGRVIYYVDVSIKELTTTGEDPDIYLLAVYDKSAIDTLAKDVVDRLIDDALNNED